MRERLCRCLAFVLAFIMTLSTITVSPVFGEEPFMDSEEITFDAPSADYNEAEEPYAEDASVAEEVPEYEGEAPAAVEEIAYESTVSADTGRGFVPAGIGGFRARVRDTEHDSIFEEDAEDMVTPLNVGAPPAPVFSRQGGVFPSTSTRTLEGAIWHRNGTVAVTPAPGWADTTIRVTFDGSVPRVCAEYIAQVREHGFAVGHMTAGGAAYQSHLIFNPASDLHTWQWHMPACGCAWVLPAGVEIPVESTGVTGNHAPGAPGWGGFINAPGDHVAMMTNHGVGRGNPGPWNVPWSYNEYLEDSAYMSPWNAQATAPGGFVFAAGTDAHAQFQRRPTYIRAAQGYYRPQPMFTGMAVRARAFTGAGIGGDTNTQTFIVNNTDTVGSVSNWQNMRIVSIVMPPEHFAHPVMGIYRNWDRGFNAREFTGAGGTSRSPHWVGDGWPTRGPQAAGSWGHMYPRVANPAVTGTHPPNPTWGGVYTWPLFWPEPFRRPAAQDRYSYNWQGQIRAGLWDGFDGQGNVVPEMWRNPDGTQMSVAERNAAIESGRAGGYVPGGYGIPVRRTGPVSNTNAGNAVIQGINTSATTSSQELRQRANVELFDVGATSTNLIFNQLANAWVFGNWTRFFPLRSIRLNFNQGHLPCSCCGQLTGRSGDVRGLDIFPGARRAYNAPGVYIDRFRHMNLRLENPESTDVRDLLSMWVAHPLRPITQHGTWGAVFINGEFWGMQNMQVHRHAALIGEMYAIPQAHVQIEGDILIEEVANFYIIHPPANIGGEGRTGRPALNTAPLVRSVDVTPGTRRTALGTGAGANAQAVLNRTQMGHTTPGSMPQTTADYNGYARRVPHYFPHNHPLAGQAVPEEWAGRSHLTREWFDYLNTAVCIDDFIDWFIMYVHLENWDSISNNVEMWRTGYATGATNASGDDYWRPVPRVAPGVHGADGRWRFIIQDFDNAIFHGANDFMTYFTAMVSPTCIGTGTCPHDCSPEIPAPRTVPACFGEPIGRMAPIDFFMDSPAERRPEVATRFIRVLLQNQYFRAYFAARYSTYTGTAFHPARMENLVREIDNTRTPYIGRHLERWGIAEHARLYDTAGLTFAPGLTAGASGMWPNATWGPILVPWMRGSNIQGFTTAMRAGNWRGGWPGSTGDWDGEGAFPPGFTNFDGGRAAIHTLAGPPEFNHTRMGWNASVTLGTDGALHRPMPPLFTGTGNPPPHEEWGRLLFRSQTAALILRALPAGATHTFSNPTTHPGGIPNTFHAHTNPTGYGFEAHQNSIEHMRAYFSRGLGTSGTNPRPGAAHTFLQYGREHQGLGYTVGGRGDYARVNFTIAGPGGAAVATAPTTPQARGDIGWFNIAGAYIRPDLYTLHTNVSGQSFFGRSVAGAPAFAIGAFSARYVRNMPIPITANAQPGFVFTHFTVTSTAGAAAVAPAVNTYGDRVGISVFTDSANTIQCTDRIWPAWTPFTAAQLSNITLDMLNGEPSIWLNPQPVQVGTTWPNPNITVTAHFRAELPHERAPIILQMQGLGTSEDGVPVSHGFIELYNPHTEAVTLRSAVGATPVVNRTLQIQSIPNGRCAFCEATLQIPPLAPPAGITACVPANCNLVASPWQVHQFEPGTTIPAGRSFLVVSQGSNTWHNSNVDPTFSHVPRLIFSNTLPPTVNNVALPYGPQPIITPYDTQMNIFLSNRNFTAAIVDGPEPLPAVGAGTSTRVYEMVGARNDPIPRDLVHNLWGSQPANSISRANAVRRLYDRAQTHSVSPAPGNPVNTRDNLLDFMQIRYGDWNMGRVFHYRPRSSSQLPWLVPFTGVGSAVTLANAGYGSNVFPEAAHAGRVVGFQAGVIEQLPELGHRVFSHWITNNPAITINNPYCRTDAWFMMPTPAVPVTVTAVWTEIPMPASSVIIHQVHGQGTPGHNAISHGFIELHNPTNSPVSLAGKSLQVMNDDSGIWNVLNFPNVVMTPGSYYLIVSTEWFNDGSGAAPVPVAARGHTPRYIIPYERWDLEWNLRFSNNSMSVAIVEGPFPLSPTIDANEWSIVHDLVGAVNTGAPEMSNYLGDGPASRMWRQGSVRRHAGARNTRDNQYDFTSHNFSTISSDMLERVRPRYSGDIRATGTVSIVGGGLISSWAEPSHNVAAETWVHVNAGTTPGETFVNWTVLEPAGMTLYGFNTNMARTSFRMPAGAPAVVLLANWDEQVIHGTANFSIEFSPGPAEPIWTLAAAPNITPSLAGHASGTPGEGNGRTPRAPDPVSRAGGSAQAGDNLLNGTLTNNNRVGSGDGFFLWLQDLGVQGGEAVVLNQAVNQYRFVIYGMLTGGAGANFQVDGRGPGGNTVNATNAFSAPVGASVVAPNGRTGNFRMEFSIGNTGVYPHPLTNWSHIRLTTDNAGGVGFGANMQINYLHIYREPGANYVAPAPTAITLAPATSTLEVGDTLSMGITIVPATASNAVNWISSNPSVASVSATGVVTAHSASGVPVTITATSALNPAVSGTASVTVTAPSPYRFQLQNFLATQGPGGGAFPPGHSFPINNNATVVFGGSNDTAILTVQSGVGANPLHVRVDRTGTSRTHGAKLRMTFQAGNILTATIQNPNSAAKSVRFHTVTGNTTAGSEIGTALSIPAGGTGTLTHTLTAADLANSVTAIRIIAASNSPAGNAAPSVLQNWVVARGTAVLGASDVVTFDYDEPVVAGEMDIVPFNVLRPVTFANDASQTGNVVNVTAHSTPVVVNSNPHAAVTNHLLPHVYLDSTRVVAPYFVTWSFAPSANFPAGSVTFPGNTTIRSSSQPGGFTQVTATVWGPIDTQPQIPHNVNVTNGTARVNPGTGNVTQARAGDFVILTPNAPTAGQIFTGWTVDIGSTPMEIRNPGSVTTANFTMPDGPVSVTANFATMHSTPIMINQVYAQGPSRDDPTVSHGFIELFNPTSYDVDLTGYSLQVRNAGSPGWTVLNLGTPAAGQNPNSRPAVVPANTSFLIVSNAWQAPAGVPRHEIPALRHDRAWSLQFSLDHMSVALVHGTTALSPVVVGDDWARVVDLVGAHSSGNAMHTYNFLGSGSAGNISRHASVRRVNFANTFDNRADFSRVDFSTRDSGITDSELDRYRPRSTNCGQAFPVTIYSEGRFYSASPSFASAGTPVTIHAGVAPLTGTPPGTPLSGSRFTNWTLATGSTTVALADSNASTTTFIMPAGAVTLNAHFTEAELPETGVMIHQVYGQGSDNRVNNVGTNSVSHGFIELFNPSDQPVSLVGMSLQVQNGSGISEEWERLALTGTIPARGSWLVASNAWYNTNVVNGVPRHVLPLGATAPGRPDQFWDVEFHNNNMVVALVTNNIDLPSRISDWSVIQDLVGIMENNGDPETVGHFFHAPAQGMSRQFAMRRRLDFRDDRRNGNNFNRIDYRTPEVSDTGINQYELEQYRPRSSTDASWGILRDVTVNRMYDGVLYGDSEVMQTAFGTQIVNLSTAAPPEGTMFQGWVASAPGVIQIRNASSLTGAWFVMPAAAITVTASFATVDMPPVGLQIHHIYGQGDHGDNAFNHSFIELYNPTNAAIPLANLSVQVQMNMLDGSLEPNRYTAAVPPTWHVLSLAGQLPLQPNHSFLIVNEGTTTPATATSHRHTVPDADIIWALPGGIRLSNRNMSVALVDGTLPLSGRITPGEWSRVYDLVGAANDEPGTTDDNIPRRDWLFNYLVRGRYDNGISRSRSIRRDDFVNTRNNRANFSSIQFTTLIPGLPSTNALMPRNRAYGAWPREEIRIMPEIGLQIHQIYGHGDTNGTNAISHSFIELYNPTSEPIDIRGFSIQVQTAPDVPAGPPIPWHWQMFSLADTSLPGGLLQPQHSYLIVGASATGTGANANHVYTIPASGPGSADRIWPVALSNRSMTVALVHGPAPLSPFITEAEWIRVQDLVGAYNSGGARDRVDNYLERARGNNGISRSRSVRRDGFTDTRDNHSDFSSIQFTAADVDVAAMRPRSSHDGAWPADWYTIYVSSIGTGSGSSRLTAPAGEQIIINAGTPPAGQMFTGWTISPAIVTIPDAHSRVASFTMPESNVTVTASFAPFNMTAPGLVINQIHGQGTQGANAFSHGFIELYNPTNEPINLANLSLQIQMNPYDGRERGTNVNHSDPTHPDFRNSAGAAVPTQWLALPLGGSTTLTGNMLPPRTSYLIVSRPTWQQPAGHVPRVTITNYDREWMGVEFNNRNMSVAIVQGSTPLPAVLTPASMINVIDLVGVSNDCIAETRRDRVHNFLGELPAQRISRNSATRRVWNGNILQNTRDNRADFEEIAFGTIPIDQIPTYRPRYSGDGEWPGGEQLFTVTLANVGDGASVNPSGTIPPIVRTMLENVAQDDMVVVFAGVRSGYEFNGWTTIPVNVLGAQQGSSSPTFVMPASDVVLTASWVPAGHAITVVNGGIGYQILVGGVTVTTAAAGATVTLVPGSNPGYNFTYWTLANTVGTTTFDVESMFSTTTPSAFDFGFSTTTPPAIDMDDVEPFSTQLSGNTFTMPNNPVTVTGHWEESGDHRINLTPGQIWDNVTFAPGVSPIVAVAPGDDVSGLPRMVGMNHPGGNDLRFAGWYIDGVFQPQNRLRDGDPITGNMNVTARWVSITGFRLGDVDNDSRTSSADATRMARWITGTPESILTPPGWTRERMILTMDINGDGDVTSEDLVLLARWLAGHNVGSRIASN
ncbi:MAG: CotH kinase family protein [Defluviitaleaceae bacterium]|nr:CotH kinase family protein [Defluviitaleaceae bacterium]MCL2261782.1 CotH kinase family protein [Defluviitaleaceae bacterium]